MTSPQGGPAPQAGGPGPVAQTGLARVGVFWFLLLLLLLLFNYLIFYYLLFFYLLFFYFLSFSFKFIFLVLYFGCSCF